MERILTLLIAIFSIMQVACDDFVVIDQPRTEITRLSVFSESTTAEAAVVDLYVSIRDGFGGGSLGAITAVTALSSDELELFDVSNDYVAVANNEVTENNSIMESIWGSAYSVVYKANAILEGLEVSNIDVTQKDRFKGEALFVRALSYFYLVNLWGDVPLLTSTNHEVNHRALRAPIEQVYDQIVTDLLAARELLPEEPEEGKTRASRAAAKALLARVYLYHRDWKNAELEAAGVIDGKLYSLESDLSRVFSVSSSEAILQLWNPIYPREAVTFLIHPALNRPLFGSLRFSYLDTFAPDDLRYGDWINVYSTTTTTFFGANKYKSLAAPPDDYSTVLRLAELYLIRAEALAQQGDLTGAAEALNIVRDRAGLLPVAAATREEMLEAIYLERKHEFFAEQGHRWLDLKRTGLADSVLSQLKPTWDHEDQLYPIPASQITGNPNIVQNPLGS